MLLLSHSQIQIFSELSCSFANRILKRFSSNYEPVNSKTAHPPRAIPGHLTRVKLRTVGNLTQSEARPVGHLTFV